MAVLKKIKFGTGTATPIAKTVVQGKPEGVISVTNTSGFNNTDSEEKDYSYDIDVNVDNATIVKSSGSLAVGEVPAAQVSVAAGGHDASADPADNKTFVGDDVEEVLLELNTKIANVGGEAKSYKVVEVQSTASTSYKEYKLQEAIGTGSYADITGSSTIVVPKDNAFVTAQLGHVGATAGSDGTITDGSGEDALLIEYINGSGVYTLVAVPIGSFLKEAEFKDGLAVSNNGEVSAKLGQGLEFGGESGENQSIKVKIDSTSESFLTVGANGVKLAGVQDAIDAKVAALDFTDTAVAGQYVSEVDETDGVISVSRANVADAVLTGYTKGNAPAAGSEAVAATDDVKGAIAKLEHQVDAAKSAASAAHSVVEEASGNTHVTVTASQPDATTGAITYTIGEDDIASAQGLADEITRAQTAEGAIDTAVGLTKASGSETRSFTPTTNYGGSGASAATSVMDNMQKLDTQLKTVSDSLAGIQYSVSGTELTFYGMTEHA